MPPLPLRTPQGDVSAPHYPKPVGYKHSLDDSDGREKRLPGVSSISVPSDRMQEFSTASACVFLQVQTLFFLWKMQPFKGDFIIFSSHGNGSDPYT